MTTSDTLAHAANDAELQIEAAKFKRFEFEDSPVDSALIYYVFNTTDYIFFLNFGIADKIGLNPLYKALNLSK